MLETPEELFDRILAVHLKAVWLGIKLLPITIPPAGFVAIEPSPPGLRGPHPIRPPDSA